jgi:hypothetical protein
MQKKISILLAIMAITAAAFVVMAPAILTKSAYAQEEFNVDVRIDSASINLKTREVTVYFTVTCSNMPHGFADASTEVGVSQKRGTVFGTSPIIGSACSEEGTPVSVTVEAFQGFFKPGKARVSVETLAFTPGLEGGILEDSAFVSEEVILRPAHP